MAILELNKIKQGMPGLTREWGKLMAQAGFVCFNHHNHNSGVKLEVNGDHKGEYDIIWLDSITDQIKASWKDLDEATELGACCVAILLSVQVTHYTIIERSVKKTGFDYWLGEENEHHLLPFEKKVRLEISGILSGSENDIRARVKKKLIQTEQSTSLGLDAHIIVVEFSNPLAHYAEKHNAN